MPAKQRNKSVYTTVCLMTAIFLSSCGALSPKEILDKANYEHAVKQSGDGENDIVLAAKQGAFSVVWQHDVGDMPAFATANNNDGVWCTVSKNGIVNLTTDDGEAAGEPFALSGFGDDLSVVSACDGKIIAVVNDVGTIYTYDMSGSLLWEASLKTRVYGAPLVDTGRLFVLGLGGQLHAYSAKLGELLWSYSAKPPAGVLYTPTDSAPVVNGGNVYIGINSGGLAALSATDGRLLWENKLGGTQKTNPVSNIASVTTPVLSKLAVCAAGYQSAIACFSASNGEPLWSKALSTLRRPALANDGAQIFAADARGFLRAYDMPTGKALWARRIDEKLSVPLSISGAVIVGDASGRLRAFSPDVGELLGETDLNTDEIIHMQAAENNDIILLTEDGQLARLRFDF